MKSPFFWKDLFFLLLLIANVAFSGWLLLRDSAEAGKAPAAWQVVLRVALVMYATASCLSVRVLALQFRFTTG